MPLQFTFDIGMVINTLYVVKYFKAFAFSYSYLAGTLVALGTGTSMTVVVSLLLGIISSDIKLFLIYAMIPFYFFTGSFTDLTTLLAEVTTILSAIDYLPDFTDLFLVNFVDHSTLDPTNPFIKAVFLDIPLSLKLISLLIEMANTFGGLAYFLYERTMYNLPSVLALDILGLVNLIANWVLFGLPTMLVYYSYF